MNADNGSLTVFHIAAEVLYLVRIGIRSAHFYGGGQVEDDGILLSSAHFLHYSLANSDGKVDFCAGKAFRRIFIANIHAAASYLFLGQLFDELSSLHGDFGDAFHILAKNNLALQGGGGVIEVNDNVFSTAHSLEGFANKLLTSLHQHLYGNIIGDVPALD